MKTSSRRFSMGPFINLHDPLVFQCFGNAPNVFLIICDEKKDKKTHPVFEEFGTSLTKNCGEWIDGATPKRWAFS